MKIRQKIVNFKEGISRSIALLSVYVLCMNSAFAEGGKNSGGDVIGTFLTTNLKDLFGSSSGFWKVFILADITLATLASVKSKNPLVFVGVFMTALVPGFLINRYVFNTSA